MVSMAMTNAKETRRALDQLFDILDLPGGGGPVRLAIAMPRAALVRLPGFPQVALPDSGRVATGRGLDEAGSRASALGEAAELVSCSAWGNETLVTARAGDIGPAAVPPEMLNGFSDSQLASRASWNDRNRDFDWRPPPCGPAAEIDWLEVEDAHGGPPAYVPADFAFIGRKAAGDERAVASGDSNGCACGASAESARLAATLELIERDAAARWWYGRRQRPVLDLAILDDTSGLVSWLYARRRRTWLFDITTDLGVPVAAAASSERDGSDVALGFAAKPDIREAALAAMTEMVQTELPLAAARKLGADAADWTQWRQTVTMAWPPLDPVGAPRAGGPLRLPSIPPSLDALVDACARAGVRLWFADMTRDALGVPAFRALSAELCHIKPRLARKRLLGPDRHDLGPVVSAPETQIPLNV